MAGTPVILPLGVTIHGEDGLFIPAVEVLDDLMNSMGFTEEENDLIMDSITSECVDGLALGIMDMFIFEHIGERYAHSVLIGSEKELAVQVDDERDLDLVAAAVGHDGPISKLADTLANMFNPDAYPDVWFDLVACVDEDGEAGELAKRL